MSPWIGLVFRLLGPALQLICIALLFQVRGQDRTFLGVSLEMYCYFGLILGLVFVGLGLSLTIPKSRSQRRREERGESSRQRGND
ncbi:hypothetical protein BH23PLA1_BH23PLA1_34780 [soil metagenome]